MEQQTPPPRQEYLEFLSPYGSHIAELALAVRAVVLEEAPAAIELIYDAYNAVATGYSFTGRPSDAFIHIAVYKGWVNLGFHHGADLPDPQQLLQGTGKQVRHVRISTLSDLAAPSNRVFIREAIARARRADRAAPSPDNTARSVVRAIYAKKRRPTA